jgi:hypothetical protein
MSDESEESSTSDVEGQSESFTLPLNKIQRRQRDKDLWDALPGLEEPYDPLHLSAAEAAALEQALCDGFGTRFGNGSSGVPLPGGMDSGLPGHRFYVTSHPTEEPDPDDERNWEFWGYGDYESDAPPPSEHFPLDFHPIRLRIYFRNQLNRYCFLTNKEEFDSFYDLVEDEQILASQGWVQFYEKPWYELYALEFLDFLEHPDPAVLRHSHFALTVQTSLAGRLGRLVEQYYWRFRYEQPAKTGLAARSGASTGGTARALKEQRRHARWQAIADRAWSRSPDLKKAEVAKEVQRDLKLGHTTRHISRYIQKKVQK